MSISRERAEPAASVLDQVQQLYDAGLYLQAFEASKAGGSLASWAGSRARTLAGRLASNIGASRLGAVLHWQAWKEDRQNLDICSYHAHTLLHRRGPLATFEFLEKCPEPATNTPSEALGHFLTVRATVAAELRDFPAADSALERAKQVAPDHAWILTSESHVRERQDRYDEALATARAAL